MRSFDLVIFDWDGTLMDSIARIVSSMQHAAQLADVSVPSAERVKTIIGQSLATGVDALFGEQASVAQKTLINQYYRQQYKQDNPTPTPLFSGTVPLLKALTAQAYQLAVATSKSRAGLDRVLAQTQLAHYFSASCCGDEVPSKPAPDMIEKLLSVLSVPASRAVLVGDSVHDLGMARNAGIASIGVRCGVDSEKSLAAFSPIAIVDEPQHVLSVLEG